MHFIARSLNKKNLNFNLGLVLYFAGRTNTSLSLATQIVTAHTNHQDPLTLNSKNDPEPKLHFDLEANQ